MRLQFVESADLNKRRVDRNYQLMGDNLTPSAEPDTYGYIDNDAALDQLLERSRATTDRAQRKQVFADIQKNR